MTSTEIASASKIILGSTEADSMYIGSTQVWTSWNPDTNGYAYVDLGLPSGTLWATMNVGANSEEDGGLYFQWGDTQGYTASQVGVDKVFNKSTYKYYNNGTTEYLYKKFESEYIYTKYNYLDFKIGLEDQDDAAHVNMGGDWHIPSDVHWNEMLNNTTKETVEINQKLCIKYTGVNGNYIIIPCCGEAYNSSVSGNGNGYYWLDSIFSVYLGQDNGRCAILYSDGRNDYGYTGSHDRCDGYNVRAVLYKPRQILTDQELSYSSSEVHITSNNTTLPHIINTNNVEISATIPIPPESFIVRGSNNNLSIDTSKGSGICQIGSTFIGDFVYKAKAIGYRAIYDGVINN